MNPFSYFEYDPNGYFRHVLAGCLIMAFLKTLDIKIHWLLIVAVTKECYDLFAKNYFDVVDVSFTLAPAVMNNFPMIAYLGIAILGFILLLIFQ